MQAYRDGRNFHDYQFLQTTFGFWDVLQKLITITSTKNFKIFKKAI